MQGLFDESEGWVFVGYMASMKSSQLIFLKPEMRISGRLHRTSSTTPPISGHFRATSSVHTGTVRMIFRWTASWRFLEEYPTTVPRLPQKNEKSTWNLHIKASFTQVSCHLGFYNLSCASIPQKAKVVSTSTWLPVPRIFLQFHTVDGWNPVNQLVGSSSHYLQGLI